MSEERYKMALEAISNMFVPLSDEHRRDSLMQEIAKTALNKVDLQQKLQELQENQNDR